MLRVKKTEWWG